MNPGDHLLRLSMAHLCVAAHRRKCSDRHVLHGLTGFIVKEQQNARTFSAIIPTLASPVVSQALEL